MAELPITFDIQCDFLEFTEEEDGIFAVRRVEEDREKMEEPNNGGGMDAEAFAALREENFGFMNNLKSTSTVRKTAKNVERFVTYLRGKGETKNPEDIEPKVLDVLLGGFIRGLTKLDGDEYEPDSITSMFGSIDRYLREKAYEASIMDSGVFKSSREMVEYKRKSLKAAGMGNKPNQAIPLTSEELEILWNNGGFGDSNPQELTAAMWYLLALHFGFRGSHETRQLKMGDIELKEDAVGDHYLEFSERLSKTRQGTGNNRAFNPKAWAKGGRDCPVRIYNEYTKRKPEKMLAAGQPFYLAINHMRKPGSPKWFSASPLGHNSIVKIMKCAGLRAGLNRRVTNHVVRKTSITTLVHAGLPYGMIAQHSGHKTADSIRHYATASLRQQKAMSAILSHKAVSILPQKGLNKIQII